MRYTGEPINGTLNTTDASAGVPIPIHPVGSPETRVLADDEYIVIHAITLVTAAGGDSSVYLSEDATRENGEVVVRGFFAADGGISKDNVYHAGVPGANAFVQAPIGVVDVQFTGAIHQDTTNGKRPNWREDGRGQ